MRRAPLIIWTLAVMITTVSITALVWWSLQTYLKNDRRVVACRDVQRSLFELTVTLQDAENSARGYLLSGQSKFLDRYRAAKGQLDARLAAARQTIPAIQMESSFDDAAALVDVRRKTLAQVMSLAERGDHAGAVARMQADESLQNLDAIRDGVLALTHTAAERLAERLAVCRASTLSMTRWVLIGVAALVLFCALLVWFMWRENYRQRRTNEELSMARDAALAATQARDEFLNVVSHELRTPLTPALLYLGNLEQSAPVGSEVREDLTLVRRQIELEVRLIDDLLNLSRAIRGRLKLTPVDVPIHSLLRHVVETFNDELADRSIPLTLTFDAANDHVCGDEPRLHQVFWHVLGNAIKFSPGNGRIDVRTRNSNGHIVVETCDTGIGLTPDQAQALFEPFRTGDPSRTRRFGGLGVGLAIVKAVVDLHRGDVRARSDGKDAGTTVTVSLPVAEAAPN